MVGPLRAPYLSTTTTTKRLTSKGRPGKGSGADPGGAADYGPITSWSEKNPDSTFSNYVAVPRKYSPHMCTKGFFLRYFRVTLF